MENVAWNEQQKLNYERVAKAISFIQQNFKLQPSLEEIAAEVNLSPFHFQRLFSDWAGTSPKKFLQYISIEHAKKILHQNGNSVFDAVYAIGLSGTSRLHDLFVNIEAMTPAEYKNGGQSLTINYSFAQTPFGAILIANTTKGICHLAFYESENQALNELKSSFPNATFHQQIDPLQQSVITYFESSFQSSTPTKLHIKGTDFQLKVWEALLKIPQGTLASYGTLANAIQKPSASRAVGTAIGSNPIAYLIPCHRVIQASGAMGGYMWGTTRKTALIGWEMSQNQTNTINN